MQKLIFNPQFKNKLHPQIKFVIIIFLLTGSILSTLHLVFANDSLLDTSFGNNGIVTTSIGTSSDISEAIIQQDDGKILVAGYSFNFNGSDFNFAVVRYNIDGTLDPTFGTAGIVTTDFNYASDLAYDIALQTDGKIIVVGESYNGSNADFAVARYNTNGSLDNSFGTSGIVITDFNNETNRAYAVSIQEDGKILVGGDNYNGTDFDFALVRYNSFGSLDTTFDSDGIVTTDVGGGDHGFDLAIQNNNKIVVAGQSSSGINVDFAVVRYNNDGSLDTSFNTDGIVITDIDGGNDYCLSLALESDNKIIVAGYSDKGGNNDITVIRYTNAGVCDTSFDEDGIVTTPIGDNDDRGHAVSLQSDGKIVVAGYSKNGTNSEFALIRYKSDGSLDTDFNTTGYVTTAIGNGDGKGHAITLQSDGKIIVSGYSFNGINDDFTLVRYQGSYSFDIFFPHFINK